MKMLGVVVFAFANTYVWTAADRPRRHMTLHEPHSLITDTNATSVLLSPEKVSSLLDTNSVIKPAIFDYDGPVSGVHGKAFRLMMAMDIFVPLSHKPPGPWHAVMCDCYVQCKPARRFGVGRKGVASYWVVAILMPFCMASLIIVCLSFRKYTYGKLDVDFARSIIALLVSIIIAFNTGFYSFDTEDVTAISQFVLGSFLLSFSMSVTFWYADIEFARPRFHQSVYLQSVSLLRVLIMIAIEYALLYVRFINMLQQDINVKNKDTAAVGWNQIVARLCITGTLVVSTFGSGYIPRNCAFLSWICWRLAGYTAKFAIWGDTTGISYMYGNVVDFPHSVVNFISSVLCLFTPVSRDRYFVAFVGCVMTMAVRAGQNRCTQTLTDFFVKDGVTPIVLLLSVLISFTLMRYHIALPQDLQLVKYVRLGYLYELRREGRMISRCQETPPSAYANPAKVVNLIIVSHHWLDKYTCDTATLEYPNGLRLNTMCTRFERFFPTAWPGWSTFRAFPFSTLRKAIVSADLSDYDVLVFWDYPCMPQIGQSKDGTLIERTAAEQLVFQKTLPAVGLLYTMFPVMVCPEVCEGNQPYTESGWCFSEWEQANLCGTLHPFSIEEKGNGGVGVCSDLLDVLSIDTSPAETTGSLDGFEDELQKKKLRVEEDRDIIRGIVAGTLVRRQLRDAVSEQNIWKVRSLLKQLREKNLLGTISYPVDATTLDTLLHLAKMLPSNQIVSVLQDHGADPTHPNHRGEEPGQFFMLRRSWFSFTAE